MPSPLPFEPANLLELALKNAAENPAATGTFYRELLESKVVIIPAGEKPNIIDGKVPAGASISLASVVIEGTPHVPFFSSPARLPTGAEYLLLDAKALFEITRGARLVLNPGAAYGKQFLPEEIARLLSGAIFQPQENHVVKKDTRVLIGQPSDHPTELVHALAQLYATLPAVKRAWVAFYHNPERDAEGGLLIAIDAEPAEMTRISSESGVVIERVPKKQKYVDLVRYDGTGVSGYFSTQKPFYQKGVLGALWRKIAGR